MTRAWLVLVRNQTLGFLREPAASLFNLAVPLFIILVQAVAYGNTAVGDILPGYYTTDVLPVGAAVIYVMIIGVFGMGVGLASMAEARTLAVYQLRPGGVGFLLSAYGAVLVVLTTAGLALSTGALAAGWHIHPPARPALLLPATVGTCVVFVALGALVASLSSSPRSAQAMSSATFFPLLFLSGSMFPVDQFPAAVRGVALVLPGYHLNQVFAYCWFSSENAPWASTGYLLLVGLVGAAAAVRIFRRREDL